MYQDECHRHMRTGGGRSGGDGGRSSSSYRDRSRDRRSSYSSDQYQSYGSGGQPGGSGGAAEKPSQGQFAQALPAPPGVGPQPLMAQQFAPPQPPLMGFMGQTPFSFTAK